MQLQVSAGYSGDKPKWYYFTFFIGIFRLSDAVDFQFTWDTLFWRIDKSWTIR